MNQWPGPPTPEAGWAGWVERSGWADEDGEAGGGSVLALAVVVALCGAVLAFAPFGAALAAHQALQGAADAAALAAADTSSGRMPGVPCEAAQAVAAAMRVDIAGCAVSADGSATVTVTTVIAGIPVSARSRAGQPERQETTAST